MNSSKRGCHSVGRLNSILPMNWCRRLCLTVSCNNTKCFNIQSKSLIKGAIVGLCLHLSRPYQDLAPQAFFSDSVSAIVATTYNLLSWLWPRKIWKLFKSKKMTVCRWRQLSGGVDFCEANQRVPINVRIDDRPRNSSCSLHACIQSHETW